MVTALDAKQQTSSNPELLCKGGRKEQVDITESVEVTDMGLHHTERNGFQLL